MIGGDSGVVPPSERGRADAAAQRLDEASRVVAVAADDWHVEHRHLDVGWIASGDLESALGEVSLDSLWRPGNATHGFMDFMLMMGVAGDKVAADYADSLDLFHTMEAYFTWYPERAE